MLSFNPRIYPKQYASGTKYWLVKCQLPGCKPHQSKHSSLLEAEKERVRLIQEHSGGGMTADQSKAFRLAQYRLDTCHGDARGRGILEAVEFFVANFSDHNNSPTVEACVKQFRMTHVEGKRWDTIEEYDRYLPRFVERFGRCRITEITQQHLIDYVALHPSPFHHRKCLVSLYGFLSGTSKKLKNRAPCIPSNEALWIPKPAVGPDKEIVIMKIDEVMAALRLAQEHKDLPYWIWCLFTGMRPCETRKFWTRAGYGWDRVDLEANTIVVNSEIAKDKRRRKIIIRPNLKEWLIMFKQNGEKMFPTGHKLRFRTIRKLLGAKHAGTRDVIRHTFISFRVAAFDKSMAATLAEAGNSERIIIDHYLDLVVNPAHVRRFWRITPRTLGLCTTRLALKAVPLENLKAA